MASWAQHKPHTWSFLVDELIYGGRGVGAKLSRGGIAAGPQLSPTPRDP